MGLKGILQSIRERLIFIGWDFEKSFKSMRLGMKLGDGGDRWVIQRKDR